VSCFLAGGRQTAIEGSVQVKKVGTPEWIDVTPATRLQVGDLVRTGQRATATGLFPDGSRFILRPDSLIIIDSMRPRRSRTGSREDRMRV